MLQDHVAGGTPGGARQQGGPAGHPHRPAPNTAATTPQCQLYAHWKQQAGRACRQQPPSPAAAGTTHHAAAWPGPGGSPPPTLTSVGEGAGRHSLAVVGQHLGQQVGPGHAAQAADGPAGSKARPAAGGWGGGSGEQGHGEGGAWVSAKGGEAQAWGTGTIFAASCILAGPTWAKGGIRDGGGMRVGLGLAAHPSWLCRGSRWMERPLRVFTPRGAAFWKEACGVASQARHDGGRGVGQKACGCVWAGASAERQRQGLDAE